MSGERCLPTTSALRGSGPRRKVGQDVKWAKVGQDAKWALAMQKRSRLVPWDSLRGSYEFSRLLTARTELPLTRTLSLSDESRVVESVESHVFSWSWESFFFKLLESESGFQKCRSRFFLNCWSRNPKKSSDSTTLDESTIVRRRFSSRSGTKGAIVNALIDYLRSSPNLRAALLWQKLPSRWTGSCFAMASNTGLPSSVRLSSQEVTSPLSS